MNIASSSRQITSLIAFLTLTSLGTMLAASHFIEQRREALINYHQATTAASRLVNGSDILTNSVRAYAATGEERYRDLYDMELKASRSRDRAIESLRSLGASAEEMAQVESAKHHSDALVELEMQAFQAAARGDRASALAMVYGESYQVSKERIMTPIEQALRAMDRRQSKILTQLTFRARTTEAIAMVSVLLSAAVTMAALFGFYGRRVVAPLTRTTQKVRELVAGNRFVRFDEDAGMEEIMELEQALDAYRQAMIDLETQQEEQQALVEAASAGIVLLRERMIVRCNRRLDELFGYLPGEQIGRQTSIWYLEDADFKTAGAEIYQQMVRGRTHVREQQLQRKDGSRFWCRMSIRAIAPDDISKGVVGIIEDISDERAALEAMMNARTLAEEAARMKSTFLANMSHEIRTPLNAIMGMTHLALKTHLTPHQKDYLKKIEGSSQHLLGIVNDILDFSKIEAGRMRMEHIEFALDRVVENAMALIVDKTVSKELELIVNTDSDVPTHLIGDPLRLGQILANFASNAVKFTDQGEIELQVALIEESDKEVLLRFSVRDSGIGITTEQKRRLFRSFEQADNSTTRRYGGTGLGLAISKHLAEMMGGEIGFDSQPGAGATFWVTLRFGRGHGAARQWRLAPDLCRRRILVVDDNDSARRLIVKLLSDMNFVATGVADGDAAVSEICRAYAVDDSYDLVLVDSHMPEMDGIATSHEIQRLPLSVSPGLVMLMPYGRDDLAQQAKAAGIAAVLVKPINPSQLFDTVTGLLAPSCTPPGACELFDGAQSSMRPAGGAHVLLVDDNELNREVATALLQEAGCDVDQAENGAIAVEKAARHRYGLILMDMQMPVMDGLAATREIRRQPGGADLPILAMTANAMDGDREQCLDAGMNDHLAKPVDPRLLWEKLAQWLPSACPAAAVIDRVAPASTASAAESSKAVMLDESLGLHLALGRAELYHSLLATFATSYRDFRTEMAAILTRGAGDDAQRLAHTLKSSAAQIGATAVSECAAQLERCLREGQPSERLAILVEQVATSLTVLLDHITGLLPEEDRPSPEDMVDQTTLQALCGTLARQLRHGDGSCRQLLAEHRQLLKAGLGDNFTWLAVAIGDDNHAAALEWLQEAAVNLGLRV